MTRSHAEIRPVGRRLEPAERRVPLLGGQPALLDAAPEVVVDALARALAELLGHLDAGSCEARLHAHLGDPGAHRPEADDADPADLPPTAAILGPWPYADREEAPG